MSVRKTALDLSAAELARRRLSRLGAELAPPADAPGGPVATDQPSSAADLRPPSWVDHPSGRAQAVRPPTAPPTVVTTPAVPATVPRDVRRGRHARQRLSWLGRGAGRAADALPPGLQGRLALTAHHVTVVALVLAAAMAVAAWIAIRSAPAPVSPPRQASLQLPAGVAPPGMAPTAEPVEATGSAPGASAAAEPGPTGVTPTGAMSTGAMSTGAMSTGAMSTGAMSTGATPTSPPVFVHVTGKVRRPGVVELAAGSRVIDAVEKAGGARPGVRLGTLNLARPVVDGEQIAVGKQAAAVVAPVPVGTVPTSAPGAGTPRAPGSLVNINTADQLELEELPGVGPVTATAIIEWRTEHGGFSTVDELLEVSGIGEVTLGELRDLVTI